MSLLAALHAQLREAQGRVTHYTNLRDMLRRRRRDVDVVRDNLSREVSGNIPTVNSRIEGARNTLLRAVESPLTNPRIFDLFAEQETGIGSDDKLTSADGDILREQNYVDEQIARAIAALEQAEQDVIRIQAAIRAEEARLAAEAAAAAAARRAAAQ